MSYFYQTSFSGDHNIGLYGFATDSFFLTGFVNKKVNQKIKETLKVPVYACKFLGISLAKLLAAGNSSGIIMPSIVPDYEIDAFMKRIDIKFRVLKTNMAVGNFILVNDKGIVISPEIRSLKNEIEKFFSLDAKITKIAGLNVVGSLGIANNKGCLMHPYATDKEADVIRNALDVEVNIGTVNFGSPYPASGIIANSSGFITSRKTSGPELGRITEALGFL